MSGAISYKPVKKIPETPYGISNPSPTQLIGMHVADMAVEAKVKNCVEDEVHAEEKVLAKRMEEDAKVKEGLDLAGNEIEDFLEKEFERLGVNFNGKDNKK